MLTGELGEPVFGQQDQITVRAHGKQTLLFAVDVLRNTIPAIDLPVEREQRSPLPTLSDLSAPRGNRKCGGMTTSTARSAPTD